MQVKWELSEKERDIRKWEEDGNAEEKLTNN